MERFGVEALDKRPLKGVSAVQVKAIFFLEVTVFPVLDHGILSILELSTAFSSICRLVLLSLFTSKIENLGS